MLKSDDAVLIGIAGIIFVVLIGLTLANNESFKNWSEATLRLGYPVPQGNLPNEQYGKTPQTQASNRRAWNSVLSAIEKFIPIPIPKTYVSR